jgi:hypothetical protein
MALLVIVVVSRNQILEWLDPTPGQDKVFPSTLYYGFLQFPLSSVYFGTFMANLNSRNYVRGEDGFHDIVMGTGSGNLSGRNTGAISLASMQFNPSSRSETVHGVCYLVPSMFRSVHFLDIGRFHGG